MEKKFVKLPSGMIIDIMRICFVGKPSAHRETPRHKPHEWSLMVQFVNDEKPTVFWYDGDGDKAAAEKNVRDDYNALVKACEV